MQALRVRKSKDGSGSRRSAGSDLGRRRRAGRRHRSHQHDEGRAGYSETRRQHQGHQRTRRHPQERRRCSHRRDWSPSTNWLRTPTSEREYPSLAEAARGVASPQIRNMGTVGGDLCQRPRCWYFRSGYGLLAMQDGKSLVPNGENRYHAIFGSGPAYFVSASSLGPALIALGAKVKLVSASGHARSHGSTNSSSLRRTKRTREIALTPNEILTEDHHSGGQGREERDLRSPP